MKRQISRYGNNQGFTLTELLVAMVLSGFVMASIGYLYYTQQKSYLVQENLAAAQQNIRSAMYFMEREIRMARCDPSQSSPASITTADNNAIAFTSDINGDGDVGDANENVNFSLDTANDQIERNSQPIAENIDALNFVYLDNNDNPIATPVATPGDIRSIQVSIVARTDRADPGYNDATTYTNQQGDNILAAQNDSFRRKQLDTTITLRN